MSCGFGVGFAGGAAAAVVGVADPGGDTAAAAGPPPSTRIGIVLFLRVTYCSFTGSKYEKIKGGMACFFSFGERTVSNVLAPLIPTSSSCLNLAEGGYLCHPWSFSSAGAVTRSKLPRPDTAAVTVIGSPTCTLFGLASTVMEKFPIAPEKSAGGLAGKGFTSSVTSSLSIGTSCFSVDLPKGSAKKGSEKKSSILKVSKGERERGLRDWLGTRSLAVALTGPMSSLPGRAAAIAVLNV